MKPRKDGQDTLVGCIKKIQELQGLLRNANRTIYDLQEKLTVAETNEIQLRLLRLMEDT